MRNSTYLLLLLGVLVPATAMADAPQKTLTVSSSAFKANEAIPSEFTCDGAETSPPLSWSDVPSEAKSIALLAEDPDATKAPFTHWMVTNIPPSETSVSAGALPAGAMAAKNDKGAMGYTGPCPPSGMHHYRFHVYALDTMIPQPANRAAFMKAIKGHVLAEGQLVGTYEKQGSKTEPTMKP